MSLRKIEILMTPKGCVVQSVNPHDLLLTIQNCTDSAITLVPLTNYCRFKDLNIVCENVLQMLTLTAEKKDWNDLSLNRVEPVLKSTKYLKFCDRLLHDMEKFIPFDIWNYILDVIQAIFPNVNVQVLRDIGDSENQQEIIDIDDKKIQFEEGSSQLRELFLRVRTTLCSVFQLCLPHLIRLGEIEKDPFLSYNGTVRPAFRNFIKSQYPRIISYAINYTNDAITIEVTGKISEQEFSELLDSFVDREKCSLLTPVAYRIFSQQDDLLCEVSPLL